MTTGPGAASMRRVLDLVDAVARDLTAGEPDRAHRLLEESLFGALLYDGLQEHRETEPWAVHYTTLDATLAILDSGGFRMYNIETSNDPLEGQVLPIEEFFRNASRQYSWFPPVPHRRGLDAYVLSAIARDANSSHRSIDDDLVWWRLYGHDGRGCAIRFNTEVDRFPMYRVRYPAPPNRGGDTTRDTTPGIRRGEEALKILDGYLGSALGESEQLRHLAAQAVSDFLMNYAYLVKDRHYRAEHEVRAVSISPVSASVEFEVDDGAPRRRFVNGPRLRDCLRSGSAITIGPSVRQQRMVRAYIERRLADEGCGHTKVHISEARYRQCTGSASAG